MHPGLLKTKTVEHILLPTQLRYTRVPGVVPGTASAPVRSTPGKICRTALGSESVGFRTQIEKTHSDDELYM